MSRLGPTGLTQLLTNIKTWVTTKLGNYVTTDTAQTVTGKKLFTASSIQLDSVTSMYGSTMFIDTSASAPRGEFPAETHRVGRIYIGNGQSYNAAWFIVDPIIDTNRACYRMVTTNPDNTDSTRFSIVWDSTKEGVRRRRNVSSGDLLPSGASTYNLGELGNAWQDAYINKIHGISDYTNLKTNSFNANTTLTHGGSGRRVILAMGTITLTVPAPEEGSWFLIKAVNGLVTLNLVSNVTVTGITAGAFSGPIYLQPNESILLCYYSSTTYNATISTIRRSGIVGRNGNVPAENPKHWFKVAENYVTATYRDPFICLRVFEGTTGNTIGTLCAHCRINNTVGVVDTANCYLQWQDAGSGNDLSKYALTTNETSGTGVTITLWCMLTSGWSSLKFEVVTEYCTVDQLGNPEWVLTRRRQADGDLAELLDTDFTKIVYSTLTTLKNDTTGKASNVTGTVAIANGGTGATTRLNAVKALTNEAVASPTHFLTITTNWGKAGYTRVAEAKTVLGITGDIGSHSDSEYVHKAGDETITGVKTFNSDTLVSNQGNAYRIANSAGTGYGVFQRTDGSYWYFMVTANNDPLGSWTSARPITIRLSDGYCTINGKANEANKVQATIAAGTTTALVQATVASNDCFRIAAGGAANAGWAEIATGDDANEPIYVRQYKGNFTTLQRTATLLDGSGNTSFPGTVTATGFSGPVSDIPSGTTYVGAVADGGAVVNSQAVGFGAIWRAPTKNYQVAAASWPSNGDNVYICYSVANTDVTAGNNTVSKSLIWAADTGTLTTTTFSGALSGNASSATEFSANKDVTLTGDVTGTASSKAGWSVTTTLSNSGVTAGTYGPSEDVTGNNNATISVPEITVDSKGRVTSVTNRTLTCKNNTYNVYNKTLTIQKNGTNVATFTSNSNTNVTANITVPTKTSELTNDSNFLTTSSSLNASKLTGTIDIARLPQGALERVITVADQTARFALTTSSVQLGDTVKQLDTGVMYVVVNESKLNSNDGYLEYTAGSASSVPWSGITSKPTEFTPSSHTHTKSDITDFPTNVSAFTNDAGYLTSHQSLSNYVTIDTAQDIEGNKNFKGLLTTIPSSSLWPSVSNTSDDITLLGGSVVHVEQKSSGKLTDLSGGAWNVVELGAGAFFFRNNSGTDIRYKHLYTGVVSRIPVVSGSNRFINDVTPNENDTYSLGTSSLRWSSCYSNAYYLGTTAFGDIVTHNASEFLTAHPAITLSSNTTSTASPAHGGTFTCIDSVTQDTNGHITKVNTKTVTLPSDNSTDTKVKQYEGTTNNERPILSRYNSTEASQTANFVVYDTGVTSNPAKHTITASGGFVGNASSATEFSANKDVTLTGDVTGTASSKAGWSVATTLANSGVTAGTYGPSADVTGSNNATILVPEITVDAKGRVTAVTNRTYKSVNTDSDKKVYQYYKSDDNVYRLLFSNNAGNTATSNVGAVYSGLNNSFYVNPSTGALYAAKLYSNGVEVLTAHQSLSSCVKNVVTNNQTIKSTGITRGTAPSSAQTFGIAFSDNNDKYIGNIYGQYATDKSTYVGLYAYKGTTTANSDNVSVRVGYDASGNAYTYAPTPATADNSTQIATTAFVKAQGYLTAHPSISINPDPASNYPIKLKNGSTFTYVNGIDRDANGHVSVIYTTEAMLSTNIPKSIATRGTSGTWTISNVPKGSILYISGNITLSADEADSYDVTVAWGADLLAGSKMSDTMASAREGNSILSNHLGMILLVNGTGASGTRDVAIELSSGPTYNLRAYQ